MPHPVWDSWIRCLSTLARQLSLGPSSTTHAYCVTQVCPQGVQPAWRFPPSCEGKQPNLSASLLCSALQASAYVTQHPLAHLLTLGLVLSKLSPNWLLPGVFQGPWSDRAEVNSGGSGCIHHWQRSLEIYQSYSYHSAFPSTPGPYTAAPTGSGERKVLVVWVNPSLSL